ncbi:hypothetical protein [Rhodococcus phage REQ1]|uniref:hypothetical protein n=1 Tax=Rhodococcus phage REQ1 TaxID=1109712 RepID=UPI00023EEBF9|nr:hypothetical protein RoPhREQ1_gp24 [Rhodococcus phage REQ1]AEV52020.1 hypothetical protein [Rhodococcus phage REQ1]
MLRFTSWRKLIAVDADVRWGGDAGRRRLLLLLDRLRGGSQRCKGGGFRLGILIDDRVGSRGQCGLRTTEAPPKRGVDRLEDALRRPVTSAPNFVLSQGFRRYAAELRDCFLG